MQVMANAVRAAALKGRVEVRRFPPFSQKTRKGWGTEDFWAYRPRKNFMNPGLSVSLA
jgi:hypothetical protein